VFHYVQNEDGIIDKVLTTKNGNGYNLAKVRMRDMRIPEVADKFACYDDKTEILTNKGWKLFKDLNKTEKVCTLVDGKIRYHKPKHYFEYEVKEQEMIYCENKHINFCVTPNHKMYVKTRCGKEYKEMRADEMFNKMVRFKKNAINDKPDIPFFKCAERNYNMDEWLKFVGMYISDGSCYENPRNRYIQLACQKQRKKEYNKKLLDNLKIIYTQMVDRFSFVDKNIAKELKKYGQSADTKHLPNYVWNLSQRQSRILLDSLIEGDGTRGDGTWRYYTVSTQLCDDIQRLALHCGWSACIQLKQKTGTEYYFTKYNNGTKF
jgi:UDP-glucuronate decarboxylase